MTLRAWRSRACRRRAGGRRAGSIRPIRSSARALIRRAWIACAPSRGRVEEERRQSGDAAERRAERALESLGFRELPLRGKLRLVALAHLREVLHVALEARHLGLEGGSMTFEPQMIAQQDHGDRDRHRRKRRHGREPRAGRERDPEKIHRPRPIPGRQWSKSLKKRLRNGVPKK